MTLSLTDELLLLVLDPASGRPALDSTRLRAVVAGTTVAGLVLDGALALDGTDKKARLRRTGTAEPTEPRLREVLELAEGRRPKDVVSKLGGAGAWRDRAGALRELALSSMTAAGVLRTEETKVLGLFPRTRWTVTDPAVVDRLRGRVTAALADSAPAPDARTAALVALLASVDRLSAVTGMPEREAKRRADAVTAGDWAAPAVRAAVEEVNAAVMAGVIAATAATTAATS
ncbi:GPP34 family phosphoprotein [Arthrobacter sp. NEB 688]|uniref:GOLPH3/VPS74 family protein n=1 Tax=Arthrobacter sp. NEB 688 TaxID=904039 RepID=UPI001565E4B0|nr:GPP34 family phosphoprotein [Arthrobacter sp. NEB 688]QKE84682.1 GPP34 family phosphoprotein [Arthrobacter sp. NEB 688]